jgi:hypothetical protein
MADPLPAGSYDISISTGFVGETYRHNRIDMRGSSIAGDMILAGNHFGTTVRDNTLLGGRNAFLFLATPTERPNIWGWSHAPFLGVDVQDNTFVDSLEGGVVSVQHSKYIKSNRGRVYLTIHFHNNHFDWSPAFLAAHPHPKGLTVGDPGGLDPHELVITR